MFMCRVRRSMQAPEGGSAMGTSAAVAQDELQRLKEENEGLREALAMLAATCMPDDIREGKQAISCPRGLLTRHAAAQQATDHLRSLLYLCLQRLKLHEQLWQQQACQPQQHVQMALAPALRQHQHNSSLCPALQAGRCSAPQPRRWTARILTRMAALAFTRR